MKHSIAVLIALTGCTQMVPAKSSSSVLPPEQTWVIVSKPAQPAALDVVRMFAARGFTLVDAESDDRGTTLRFRGERKTVSEQIVTGADVALAVLEVTAELSESEKERRHHHHYHVENEPTIATYEIGSVFYVRVEPRGTTMTSIAAVGRPTNHGIEACTGDAIAAPCQQLETGEAVHGEVAGFAEAETIHGVFAEMRVGGSVVAPDLKAMASMEDQRHCWALRHEKEQAAARVSDPRAKAGIMRTAPTCTIAAEPTVAAANPAP